jgi:DNA-binding MarR family transcriptional regulator
MSGTFNFLTSFQITLIEIYKMHEKNEVINPTNLHRKSKITYAHAYKILKEMHKIGLIKYELNERAKKGKRVILTDIGLKKAKLIWEFSDGKTVRVRGD